MIQKICLSSNFSLNQVVDNYHVFRGGRRVQSNYKRLSSLNHFFLCSKICITPFCIRTINSWNFFGRFLHCSRIVYFLLTHPTRIRFPFCNKLLHKCLIDFFTMRLRVWSVISYIYIVFTNWSFIWLDTKNTQSINQLLNCSWNFTFLICVFYAQEENAIFI